MIGYKHISKIVAAFVFVAAIFWLCVSFSASESGGIAMQYETELFGKDDVIKINIIMDGDDFDEMLENAISEEYYSCDVEVNGEVFYGVGIRPKGNTSLSSVYNDPDTERYSFKLEFDKYVDGQTCFGLDKLVLNNNYADATNMKEALVYDMYEYLGADASLYNYAEISVNGEYWGVYLALEAVEDSFVMRNYGTENGDLYKPEGVGTSEGGANLNYIDDDVESYGAIWDGALSSVRNSDKKRVVEALKNVSNGTDLEKYLDVDNLLRYAAVHVFAVNADSLTGNMAHNYYLYEHGGKLNILPWDYNLSFGGMGQSDAESVVNSAIDEAFVGTEFFDALMENEEYHEKYLGYLRELVDGYVNGGGFESFLERVREQIDGLVKTDPTAFYSYEEYEEAVSALEEVVSLRAESVSGQIDGSIPSLASARKTSDALIAASVDLGVMGEMNGGGKPSGQGGGMNGMQNGQAPSMPNGETPTVPDGEMPSMPNGETPSMPNGETPTIPDGEMPTIPDGENSTEPDGENSTEPDGSTSPDDSSDNTTDTDGNLPTLPNGNGDAFPDGNGFSGNVPTFDKDGFGKGEIGIGNLSNLILYGVCFVIFAAVFVFAILYKRRPRI